MRPEKQPQTHIAACAQLRPQPVTKSMQGLAEAAAETACAIAQQGGHRRASWPSLSRCAGNLGSCHKCFLALGCSVYVRTSAASLATMPVDSGSRHFPAGKDGHFLEDLWGWNPSLVLMVTPVNPHLTDKRLCSKEAHSGRINQGTNTTGTL